MKLNTKLIIIFLFATFSFSVLSACGSTSKNVPVSELSEKITAALDKSGMSVPPENYVKGYMKRSASEIGEYVIMKNVIGTNIDEFGIFKAGTMTTTDIKQMVEEYLKTLRDSWMNYQPEEEPKLTGAEIKVSGDYVMYCILDEADRTTAFKVFSDSLK